MFSLNQFYSVLSSNILNYLFVSHGHFTDFGSTSEQEFAYPWAKKKSKAAVLFYDQEPILLHNEIPNICDTLHTYNSNILFANSEHSELKNSIIKQNSLQDWYYFFHGFAALSWFEDNRYSFTTNNVLAGGTPIYPAKTYSCLNHLVTADRSYRLALVSEILSRNIKEYGHVSSSLENYDWSWKDEVESDMSKLSSSQKEKIKVEFSKLSAPLIVDQTPGGNLSASVSSAISDAYWHVVPETVFYYQKLHLTEKIFKPIVSKRPFILVGATNNLQYLKSYGFKTFSKYIDESYDAEPDNEKRLTMIANELEKLCNLSVIQQHEMFLDMQDTLNFNYYWFYNDFKHVVVDEMITNLRSCLTNADVHHQHMDWRAVHKLLTQ
jgi:hypothetical protein